MVTSDCVLLATAALFAAGTAMSGGSWPKEFDLLNGRGSYPHV